MEIRPSRRHSSVVDSAFADTLPSPDFHAEPVERVLHYLRQETLRIAGVIAETGTGTGKCGGEVVRPRGETVRCTVSYEGVSVPWLVTSKGIASGSAGAFSQDFVYPARPLKIVLTAQSVYDRYAWETGKNGTTAGPTAPVAPRCDRLPKMFTAEPGKETDYFCQDISTTCTDNVQHVKWHDHAIYVGQQGRLSFYA